VLDNYKKNLVGYEQYRKWNSGNEAIPTQYAALAADYQTAIDMYNTDLSACADYIKGNRKLFASLADLSARQMKLAVYIEKVEEKRKALEEKTIAEKQAFDVKENQKQRDALKEVLGKLDKLGRERR
jgi:hypothetical protein